MNIDNLKFNDKGLIPCIAQDARTRKVLMLAYMNKESLALTEETGYMHYYSRSREQLWKKGETSGHVQQVVSLAYDCDGDTILAQVIQTGAACHTGEYSCFFNELLGEQPESEGAEIIDELYDVVDDRKRNPKEGSYTNYLYDKGLDKILKKVGEEATEVVIAAKNEDKEEVVYEMGDLLYHLIVLMREKEISPSELFAELRGRR
ncbi:MAG: bifunctional phosphoribosyl-AMP cyclohydrolase/phosphoribosyl-ATP diphosphatase HisIE [Christensenellaceae bacterium]